MDTELFWGFNLQAWITIATVFSMFTVLLLTKLRTDVVFLGAIGVLSVIAMRRLLPERKTPESAFESTGEYTVELQVPSDNPYIGQSLSEAGIYNIKSGSLIKMYHFDDIPQPITEDELIMGGDHLIYAGQIDEIIDMAIKHQLVSADHHIFSMDELDKYSKLRTAYVTFGSGLIGKTIGGSTFERDNNVMLAAVSRLGERIKDAPRQVVLKAGDTLLLICPNHFKTDTPAITKDL